MLKIVNQVRSYSGSSIVSNKLGILGVPSEYGQPKPGTSQAPDAIRNAGLIDILKSTSGMDIKDYGNITSNRTLSTSENVHNMKQFTGFCKYACDVSNSVKNVINDGRICLTLGGDHSIGAGTVHGHLLAENNVSLLWVDAHADINTNITSDTGHIHGMPVSMVIDELKKYWSPLPGMEWLSKSISSKHVAYIGLRSVDLYERLILDKYGIVAYGMRDIEKYGIDNVVNMALEKIDPRCNRSLHVSYDIDSLDPLEAPSTGTPVRGGLSLREGIHIMETIRDRGNLTAMDLVEVNPMIGNGDDVKRTIDAALQVIMAAFSGSREGIRDINVENVPTNISR